MVWLRSSTTSRKADWPSPPSSFSPATTARWGATIGSLEKLGFWDESYHVPLIVVDPRRQADGSRGTIVEAVTESVDVLPTICDFMGIEVPRQADGWSLDPFLRGEPAPPHWRDTAHFEWSFSDPVNLLAERAFGIPMSHCALAVSRGPRYKYVQFAADASLLPPLLFDLVP